MKFQTPEFDHTESMRAVGRREMLIARRHLHDQVNAIRRDLGLPSLEAEAIKSVHDTYRRIGIALADIGKRVQILLDGVWTDEEDVR